jgi:hypothetical protein
MAVTNTPNFVVLLIIAVVLLLKSAPVLAFANALPDSEDTILLLLRRGYDNASTL